MTFEQIIKKSQLELKAAIASDLKRLGYNPVTKDGFVYAKGTLPVMLVAHLDTVHKKQVKTICYSRGDTIIMSPEGIGGDDRCGVFMILEIIKKHRCHVLFTEDEEVGGKGALKFTKSEFKPSVNFIVELDRRGSNDAVFYDCDNPDFTRFITSFGFKESVGSFSDISVIAPHIGAAAVNISSGFYNEHTLNEYIDMSVVHQNIKRVGDIVSAKSEPYKYIESDKMICSVWSKRYNDYSFEYYKYCEIEYLMPLSEKHYIKYPNGLISEADNSMFVDELGNVYEYSYADDIAVITDAEAYTENSMPVRWSDKDAEAIPVMPLHEYENYLSLF